jgi:hypothetical protein
MTTMQSAFHAACLRNRELQSTIGKNEIRKLEKFQAQKGVAPKTTPSQAIHAQKN